MKKSIPQELYPLLSELIATKTGLHFPAERWSDLERGLRGAAAGFGFNEIDAFSQWLLNSDLTREQLGELASYITVGETYFFRDSQYYDILESEILPAIVTSRQKGLQRLRLWSAACATGEEAYSLAIVLSRVVPDIENWNVTVLASDINPVFLEKAKKGIYTKWSFRSNPEYIKNLYFKKLPDGRFEVLPRIKRLVNFQPLNLVEDTYPSLHNNTNAIDVIFCRNVLMYLAPYHVKRIVKQLHNSLVDGGWLIVSPAEASHVLFADFDNVRLPDAILYRRGGTQPSRPASDSVEHTILQSSNNYSSTIPEEIPHLPISPVEPAWAKPETLPIATEEPPSPVDVFEAASAFYDQGNYQSAAEILEQLIAQQSDDARSLALLARVYANQGRLVEAREQCRRAINADKLNPGCYYLSSRIAEELNLIDEASQALRQALYLDPDFVVAHFALGNLNRKQGRQFEADRHFKVALRLLEKYSADALLPESDGLTAGRLSIIIRTAEEKG
jgi:chemotaxis protein methyltransferase CheR